MSNTQELIDFILSTIKETKSFVVEQAPDVAKEILSYGLYEAKVELITGIISGILGLGCIYAWII
jgi:hypothetical protein